LAVATSGKLLDLAVSRRCVLGLLEHRQTGSDDQGRAVVGITLPLCAVRNHLVSTGANGR
jgi:hypothetical protein